jgi:molybdopterin-guanine dinucleotide biosynthesis protein A
VRTAGIVLAGGRSSRMGTAKASLDWHGSTLLRRVAGVVARSLPGAPVVVARAPGQPLPALPPGVEVLDDPVEGRGPLQGIAVGLAALVDRADLAFACSTDLPFLHPAFVRRVLAAFADEAGIDVVLPVAHGHHQPLAAGYRTGLAPRAAKLVEAGRLKPGELFEEVAVRRLDDAALLGDPQLAAADPRLRSVVNVNSPADLAAALAQPEPDVTVRCFGVAASRAGRGPQDVRAATVGRAAAAIGLTFDRHVLAAVNGDQTSRDPQLPLVPGDEVAFLSADAGG